MGVWDKLAKLGVNLSQDVGDDVARKVLEKAEELQKAKQFGKTIVKEEIPQYGKVIHVPDRKTTLQEAMQAAQQKKVIDAERNLNPSLEPKQAQDQSNILKQEGTPLPPEQRTGKNTSIKEMLEELNRIKKEKDATVKGMALGLPVTQVPQVDMNPLPDIKAGYEAYKGLKDQLYDKLATQLDVTPDKAVKQDLKGAMDIALDPLNAAIGPVGMGLGAVQMGLEALPSEKASRFDKLKDLFGKK